MACQLVLFHVHKNEKLEMETNSILSPLSYFLFQAMLQWFWPPWLGSSNRFSDLANSSRPSPSPPSSHGLWSFFTRSPCLASLLAGALSSLRCTSNWIPFCSYSLLSPWVWPLDTGGQQEHGCHSHLCPQRYFRFGLRFVVIAGSLLPALAFLGTLCLEESPFFAQRLILLDHYEDDLLKLTLQERGNQERALRKCQQSQSQKYHRRWR